MRYSLLYEDISLYNCHHRFFKQIPGALRQGQACSFSALIPRFFGDPCLCVYPDGEPEHARKIEMVFSGFYHGLDVYSCCYTPARPGLYFYTFIPSGDNPLFCIAQGPDGAGFLYEGEPFHGPQHFPLTVYRADFCTPDFIKGKIMYQIFPDRFYKSGEAACPYTDRILRPWGEMPYYAPNAQGEVLNNDYFGGNLKGIMEKLPYLKALGVSVLYLNPIFEAHSNHRYNTADYLKIDPLLGTEEDFINLCRQAGELEIKIILDGVFSHTGSDSVYFNKQRRYGDGGAYNSQQSPYYSWYSFQHYPDAYSCWWGFSTLPEVQETNSSFLEFICGEKGVLEKWINNGAWGFRLDVADELPDAFLDSLHKRVKQANPQAIVIGEVWEDASTKSSYGKRRRYLQGRQLDSVMNYPFKDAILSFVKGGSAQDFARCVTDICEHYPPPVLHCLMNSLSTHDTPRALTVLAGESIEQDKAKMAVTHLGEEQLRKGRQMLRLAFTLQFFLPGVPCIYYGDEAAMQGYKDPFNRQCFNWDSPDSEMQAFVKELSALRLSCPILAEGDTEFIYAQDNIAIFKRFDNKTRLYVCANISEGEVAIPLTGNTKQAQAFYSRLENGNWNVPAYTCGVITINASLTTITQ